MIVVSDSTPLIQLAKAGRLDILFSLYKKILITKDVYSVEYDYYFASYQTFLSC